MTVHSTGHALPKREGEACEDAWTVAERGGAVIAALADGVGSSREGGAAARRAVEMLADYCLSRPSAWSPRRALAEFTAQINRHLYSESLQRHGQPELACTLSAVLLDRGHLYGCNVGDSPVFHWRRGRLRRLSENHTATDPGLDHVLTRAIGLEAGVEPHFFELEIDADDLVLLCTDGVANVLSDHRLAELLSRRSIARSFVTAAREAAEENDGPQDDACAIVLEIADRGIATGSTRQRLEVIRTLRAGDAIDGFRLEKSLDERARIWLAEDSAHVRAVLKFPPLEAEDTEAVRDAFVREAWNATRLASPDLVRAWMPDNASLRYYAMEFVDAPTLRTALRAGQLGVEEACELARFLLRSGQFLLAHDLAHGDIKPDNILVVRGPSGTSFRLLDLGSAAELFSVRSRAGTASYLAPERFREGALSERTEIFAMGVTVYEALTGAYPYGEVERFQTPRFEGTPRRPSRLNPAIPPWLESVLLRALEADPERRYQHFSEMAYELSHPDKTAPYFSKEAGLLERNPLLFYKLLCLLLAALSFTLIVLLLRR